MKHIELDYLKNLNNIKLVYDFLYNKKKTIIIIIKLNL